MRRFVPSLPLLAALIVSALPAGPAAAADGGSASCNIPFEVARGQQLGEMRFDRGSYKLTVLDTSQLNCNEASGGLRAALREPGADLPAGWTFDSQSHVLRREDGTDAVRVEPEPDDVAISGGGGSFWDGMENFALTWLPIIFMGLIAIAVVWMVQYMPRTKPQEIAPSSSSSVRWEDVAGVEEAKDELREVVEFMRDPKRFKKLGAKVPKGILLHGPPGTGKTLLAKAVARESNAKFFAQSASSFVEMFAGLGAARIRRLFRAARKQAPAIVFIDELDAVGATRGKDISGEKDQTLNQLLVEMDGFSSADNIVVISASNLLEKLDSALLRYLKSKEELIKHMVVLLAGRVSEHGVFGAITTGASDDLKRVYELSRAMISEYGMGTELMSRQLPPDDYSVSDSTRRLVDEEQRHLTDLAWRRALALLVERRPLLDALAATARAGGTHARGHRADRGGRRSTGPGTGGGRRAASARPGARAAARAGSHRG